MKKVIGIVALCLVACGIFSSVAPVASAAQGSKSTSAEQVLGSYCCDGYGYRRCVLDTPFPVGASCFCRGQGYGYTCR